MQTIVDILRKAGGWHPGLYLKIDNVPYMELVIEAMDDSGPMGLPAISVAQYGDQNGDLMRDPEMCFELGNGGLHLDPFYWRNDEVSDLRPSGAWFPSDTCHAASDSLYKTVSTTPSHAP
jgi:hypothetical protein